MQSVKLGRTPGTVAGVRRMRLRSRSTVTVTFSSSSNPAASRTSGGSETTALSQARRMFCPTADPLLNCSYEASPWPSPSGSSISPARAAGTKPTNRIDVAGEQQASGETEALVCIHRRFSGAAGRPADWREFQSSSQLPSPRPQRGISAPAGRRAGDSSSGIPACDGRTTSCRLSARTAFASGA